MKSNFYLQIENSSAYRESRDANCKLALSNTENIKELFHYAYTLEDKNHFKACWILELVLEKDLQLLTPYLDTFCETISKYEHDSAKRPMSKICMFISKNKKFKLTEKQEKKIIEACLDWLISDEKVATKAYSIRALYNFSKKHSWIKNELKIILAQDYSSHSVAYKAVAREILKKLN